MYDNENQDQVNPNEQEEGISVVPKVVASAEPKNKNWGEREWFILDATTNEIWKDQLYSEKECRNRIRVDGEYDVEYRIGYRVIALNTVIKTSRIVLK